MVFGLKLTQFVFSWIVGDLHDVELQPAVALPDGVDPGDVRTLLVHGLHQLTNKNKLCQTADGKSIYIKTNQRLVGSKFHNVHVKNVFFAFKIQYCFYIILFFLAEIKNEAAEVVFMLDTPLDSVFNQRLVKILQMQMLLFRGHYCTKLPLKKNKKRL